MSRDWNIGEKTMVMVRHISFVSREKKKVTNTTTFSLWWGSALCVPNPKIESRQYPSFLHQWRTRKMIL